MAVANADVKLAAARKNLHESIELIWTILNDLRVIDDDAIANVWSAANHAANTARAVSTDIYAVTGTASLYVTSPIERAHRDVHAVLQHGIIQPHWMSQVGKVKLGLKKCRPNV